MASFKILDVQESYAVVEITFDNTTFDDYDDNGNPITVSHQVYKLDDLVVDNSETVTYEITELVTKKINEIEPISVPQDVSSLIGEIITI